MDTIKKVKEFYEASDCRFHKNKRPIIPNYDQALLKISFLNEEIAELSHAFVARDKVKVLDALTDLQYFLDGVYLLCGMSHLKGPAFNEVHCSNMTKFVKRDTDQGVFLDCVRDDAGKIIKPPTYEPPNLKQFFKTEELL